MKIFIYEDTRQVDNEVPCIVILAESKKDADDTISIIKFSNDYELVKEINVSDKNNRGIIYSNYLIYDRNGISIR